MRLPRDLSSTDLVRALIRFGYEVSRQTGSHIRLSFLEGKIHHITIPAHDPIRVGTLNAIIRDLCSHHNLDREALLRILFE